MIPGRLFGGGSEALWVWALPQIIGKIGWIFENHTFKVHKKVVLPGRVKYMVVRKRKYGGGSWHPEEKKANIWPPAFPAHPTD